MSGFLIPYKTGEKTKPGTYREFKARISAYDVAKDPDGRRLPVTVESKDSTRLQTVERKPESVAVVTTVAQSKKKSNTVKSHSVTCQLCGKTGHSAKECFTRQKDSNCYRQPKC